MGQPQTMHGDASCTGLKSLARHPMTPMCLQLQPSVRANRLIECGLLESALFAPSLLSAQSNHAIPPRSPCRLPSRSQCKQQHSRTGNSVSCLVSRPCTWFAHTTSTCRTIRYPGGASCKQNGVQNPPTSAGVMFAHSLENGIRLHVGV